MARYIDADKIVDIIKMDIKQCEIDVSESCGDEFYEMAVNSRSNAMYSILREIENAPAADVVPKSEVERLLEDFQGSIRADAKVGMSAGEILLHINNMLVEFKNKYTGDKR